VVTSYRPEKAYVGYVKLGAERIRLFTLVAFVAGAFAGCGWIYWLTFGEGQRHIVGYLSVSYRAALAVDEPVAVVIRGKPIEGDAEKIRVWMRDKIYGGRTVSDLWRHFLWSFGIGAGVTLVGLVYFTMRKRPEGDDETVRGPEVLTVPEINKHFASQRDWIGRKEELGIEICGVRLTKRAEASHILLLGDSGAGKSTVLRDAIAQIRERDEAAIIYDPEREFASDFFIPGKDMLLNPLDARSPYWDPWQEVVNSKRAHMEAIARSFVPDPAQDGQNAKFWTGAARTLLIALMQRTPERTPQALSSLLNAPPEALVDLLADTPAANVVNPNAPQQAQGVLGTLAIAASSLAMLRPPEAGVQRFSAIEWAKKPKGFIFLCSTEQDRDALLPLISVWLDCLIRPLLDTPLKRPTPVWVIADELQTLQRLSQLPNLLTRGRKRGLRSCLGCQSSQQFKSIYGTDAQTLLSQPMTKLVCRTSEPETSKWASDLIGQVERITHRASVSVGGKDSFNLSDERRIDPLILPSELQKLPNLHAIMIHAGLVCPTTVPLMDRLERVPDFIERRTQEEADEEAAATLA
jgi:hypothetical protein